MLKKLASKIKAMANGVKAKVNTFVNSLRVKTVATVCNASAEGYVDTGVKILISVVIGALVLALLYALFKTTVMTSVTSKVTELFAYTA